MIKKIIRDNDTILVGIWDEVALLVLSTYVSIGMHKYETFRIPVKLLNNTIYPILLNR